jgi:hypothetical protein
MANLPMYDAPTSAPPKPKTIAVPEYDAPTYAPPKDQPKYDAPASAPPKDQLKFDAPKGPPPSGMKAPARQNMHTEGGKSARFLIASVRACFLFGTETFQVRIN